MLLSNSDVSLASKYKCFANSGIQISSTGCPPKCVNTVFWNQWFTDIAWLFLFLIGDLKLPVHLTLLFHIALAARVWKYAYGSISKWSRLLWTIFFFHNKLFVVRTFKKRSVKHTSGFKLEIASRGVPGNFLAFSPLPECCWYTLINLHRYKSRVLQGVK